MPQTDPWAQFPVASGAPAGAASTSGTIPPLPSPPKSQDPADAAREAREAQRFQWDKEKHDRESADVVGIPSDQMHLTGKDFIAKLPPADAAQVQALAEGRMAFPAGKAASSPYWQQRLAQVAQYDPDFDAVNYNARAKTRADFTSGTSSRNIKALNTAIGHVGQLADQISGTASHGGFPFATTVNAIQNAAERGMGDPGITNYAQTAGAVAGELTQVFRGSGGAEADIQRYLSELDPNASEEQKKAAIANITTLLKSRLDALNDQYVKGMGTTAQPLDVLDPHSKQVLAKYLPGFTPPGSPPVGGAGGDGGPGGAPAGTLPTPPVIGPGPDKLEVATGDTRRVADPEMTAQLDQMVRKGTPLGEINQFLGGKGMAPIGPNEYGQVQDFLKQHPDYQGSVARAWKLEPQSGFEKVVGKVAATPVGGTVASYAAGAGQFLSGNTLDNIAPDPERARGALDMLAEQHPTANAIGGISGGVLGSMAGEAGLARMGVGASAGRGLLADMAMGGVNGAGASDGGDRIGGGLRGALEAGAGNIAGRAVTRGLGRLVAPSGGDLAGLYEAGVRPTIGQRAAAINGGRGVSGTIGKAINATEEGLQSVPIVGAAIRGARQEARDQFQTGAFNEALKEVGEELPKGMSPGTDPHAYTQRVFSKAYDTAREGMHMVADEELSNDLGSLAAPISELGPQARNKLAAIMANVVTPKVADGQMTGANFKKVVSDLGKRIERFRKSDASDDQAMADILQGVSSAIEGAARRHSDPDAVKLLDAADAGYAKFVRIEDAARRRGGDAGTFSPAQFDASVQNTSGGVRSKAFLRGDALMQDYAKAGRALEDKMPNSGTPERMAVGGLAAGGAAYLEPTTLAVLGAIGGAYAPGVRKVVKGAIAPRGAVAARIRQQLEKVARLSGAVSASTAVVGAQGTSPSP